MVNVLSGLRGLLVTLVSSILLILVGIVYFMVTVWIIKVGASWAGYPSLDGATVVGTAGLITAASMIGSAIQK